MTNELYKHMQWADATVWRSVLATPQAENDSRLRELLYHIHVVQRAFLAIWTNQPLDFPEESAFENLTAISRWGYEYYQNVNAYLNKITDSALEEIVELPWSKRIMEVLGKTPDPTTLGETILQVALHTMHHRGQVTVRLRELGGKPPLIDFIAWVWHGKPEADWPESIKS
ncbi:damage-inducible protein DinB [candidate division KSB1 bacterium]|nr:damage-inducible protein DinB [candidate division KSB1 bacterium]NIR73375.1 damage-inducible protein DinB [candidate division KSB1 bacterium]NIS25250.1 damage-inducible protein DinB [candidate division KSB1 bacterium]NIT72153.1 damage-inducible protein DinB [candidate division KSB1 bacterium]NIU25959.1 damage-inducible protein DinB [candidate division KSB1 bacterium]